MNLVSYLKLSIIAPLLFLACTSGEDGVRVSLVMNREIRLTTTNNNLIGQIYDLAIDDKGLFYLCDRTSNTVWAFNNNGSFVRRIGEIGRGPGELSRPVSIALKNDTLAVLEAGNQRTTFFHLNGKFISSIHTGSSYLSGIELSRKGDILVSESLGHRQYKIYNSDGKLTSKLLNEELPPVILPVQIPGGHMSHIKNGNILYANIRKYEVVELNWQGDTLLIYSAKPSGYVAPDLRSRAKLKSQLAWSILVLPLQVEDMILIQRLNRRVDAQDASRIEWDKYIDVFTSAGESKYLGTISSPYTFLMAKADLLYGLDYTSLENGENNPSIVVYSLR